MMILGTILTTITVERIFAQFISYPLAFSEDVINHHYFEKFAPNFWLKPFSNRTIARGSMKADKRFFTSKLQKRLLSPINRIIFSFLGPKLFKFHADMVLQTLISELVRKLASPLLDILVTKFSGVEHIEPSYEYQASNIGHVYKPLPNYSPSLSVRPSQVHFVVKTLPSQRENEQSSPSSLPLSLSHSSPSSSSSSSSSSALSHFISQQVLQQFEQQLRQQIFQQLQSELFPNLPPHLNQKAQEEILKLLPKIYQNLKEELNTRLGLPQSSSLTGYPTHDPYDYLNPHHYNSQSNDNRQKLSKSMSNLSKASNLLDDEVIAKMIKFEFKSFPEPIYSQPSLEDTESTQFLSKKPKTIAKSSLLKKLFKNTFKYLDNNNQDEQEEATIDPLNTDTLISYANIRDIIDQDDDSSKNDEKVRVISWLIE